MKETYAHHVNISTSTERHDFRVSGIQLILIENNEQNRSITGSSCTRIQTNFTDSISIDTCASHCSLRTIDFDSFQTSGCLLSVVVLSNEVKEENGRFLCGIYLRLMADFHWKRSNTKDQSPKYLLHQHYSQQDPMRRTHYFRSCI